jgi:hypothetical protein
VRLRDKLGIERADFAKAIEELKALASADAAAQSQQQAARAAEASTRKDEPRKPPATGGNKPVKKQPAKQNKPLAIALGIGGVAALVFGVWFALRDTSKGFDLSDVASTVQLSNGRVAGPSLTATIADPKWDSMSVADRKKAAAAVMDVEAAKGIKALTLLDGSGHEAAAVNETPNGRMVTVP